MITMSVAGASILGVITYGLVALGIASILFVIGLYQDMLSATDVFYLTSYYGMLILIIGVGAIIGGISIKIMQFLIANQPLM